MQKLDLNTQGSLTALKDRLMFDFEKEVAEYKSKLFQQDSVNIFGTPNFTSVFARFDICNRK